MKRFALYMIEPGFCGKLLAGRVFDQFFTTIIRAMPMDFIGQPLTDRLELAFPDQLVHFGNILLGLFH